MKYIWNLFCFYSKIFFFFKFFYGSGMLQICFSIIASCEPFKYVAWFNARAFLWTQRCVKCVFLYDLCTYSNYLQHIWLIYLVNSLWNNSIGPCELVQPNKISNKLLVVFLFFSYRIIIHLKFWFHHCCVCLYVVASLQLDVGR